MKKEVPRRRPPLPGWQIELRAGRELLAEGSAGVVRCDPDAVVFRVSGGVFCVYGEALTIGTMQDGRLMIRGRIFRTELET